MVCEGYIVMASSKVVRYSRQESLHKEPSPSVDSSTTSDSSDGEKDLALEDFDFIKTIGECCFVVTFAYLYLALKYRVA